MSQAMTAVPDDHPLMVAWNEYKKTDDFANTMKWAKQSPQYVDGSLWGAFMAGFKMATERAASLHESVRTNCDHEPGAGAGAMGAVINYRDLIRETTAI